MAKPRNYRLEYDAYQGTEEQKKRRAKRNHDRKEAERKGTVRKGDGEDIHHENKEKLSGTRSRDKSKNRADNKHKKGEKQRSWK